MVVPALGIRSGKGGAEFAAAHNRSTSATPTGTADLALMVI